LSGVEQRRRIPDAGRRRLGNRARAAVEFEPENIGNRPVRQYTGRRQPAFVELLGGAADEAVSGAGDWGLGIGDKKFWTTHVLIGERTSCRTILDDLASDERLHPSPQPLDPRPFYSGSEIFSI